ncbi:uncharacterized protein LOC131666170 [Phymastichus coffea]|uniref:uncharacterized protein LOC131666170 n=1 Tax=Phymastichus coffea TaxID=108790 RepID=UPI00273ADED7|nr:uncharacterized protein LOC131666170 [Phymastichus coffea]
MLGFHIFIIIIIVSLSHELTVHNENKTKETVYYKRTEHPVLDANRPIAKDEKMTMEESPVLIKKESTKIKPRKGVLADLDYKVNQNDNLPLDNLVEKPVQEKTDEGPSVSESLGTSKLTSTTQKSTTLLHTTLVHEKQTANVIIKINSTTTVRQFNPKPTVTFAEEEGEDESMPQFPTSKTLLGMPRKIDYIVPVIITITALPLLGAAFYVLYKRGRDYWDKRHYRRMDFLIDGMYNE